MKERALSEPSATTTLPELLLGLQIEAGEAEEAGAGADELAIEKGGRVPPVRITVKERPSCTNAVREG